MDKHSTKAQTLVARLNNLHEIFRVQAEILSCGEEAVDALIRALEHFDLETLGPVQRFAEQMVRNTAARRLARFRQARVIQALLASLRRDHLIGAGEALAQLGT